MGLTSAQTKIGRHGLESLVSFKTFRAANSNFSSRLHSMLFIGQPALGGRFDLQRIGPRLDLCGHLEQFVVTRLPGVTVKSRHLVEPALSLDASSVDDHDTAQKGASIRHQTKGSLAPLTPRSRGAAMRCLAVVRCICSMGCLSGGSAQETDRANLQTTVALPT